MTQWEKMQEQWLKYKTWWSHLSMREKNSLILGAAVLAIFIFYQFIWAPWLNHIAAMRKHIETEQKLLVWMQSADQQLQSMQQQAQTKNTHITPIVLLDILQTQMQRAGMRSQLTQLKQASNDSVELQLQKIDFDKFMQWLITFLAAQPVSIAQLSVAADVEPGIVDINMVLKS
jgi:type II secretory pathway component PulM